MVFRNRPIRRRSGSEHVRWEFEDEAAPRTGSAIGVHVSVPMALGTAAPVHLSACCSSRGYGVDVRTTLRVSARRPLTPPEQRGMHGDGESYSPTTPARGLSACRGTVRVQCWRCNARVGLPRPGRACAERDGRAARRVLQTNWTRDLRPVGAVFGTVRTCCARTGELIALLLHRPNGQDIIHNLSR
jgi:hypothetical protein